MDEKIKIDPYSNIAADIVRNFFEGLNFYREVPTLRVCDSHIDDMSSEIVLALSQWIYGQTLAEYEQGAWFFTDSLGTSSFVVRNCYQSYAEFDALFGNMTQVYHEFPIFAQ